MLSTVNTNVSLKYFFKSAEVFPPVIPILYRGFESGIYSHDVRTYVRVGPSRLGMSR